MAGIPARGTPHTVTVVTPAEGTDAYNNVTYDYGVAATRVAIEAWLQQDQRTETREDGRTVVTQVWLLMTNYELITELDQIEWASHPTGPKVFTIEGEPEPAYTPAGFHHTELTMRIVSG